MLKLEDPCKCCPASRNYAQADSPDDLWDNEDMLVCKMCWGFLGYPSDAIEIITCPCLELGSYEAINVTQKALKAKGY